MVQGGNTTGLSQMDAAAQIELLKSILESTTEYSIIVLDLSSTILAWNAGAERTYGYSASEIIGKNASILHEANDVKSGRVQAIFDQTLLAGVWTGEIDRAHKDGSQFKTITTITVRKNLSNTPIGFTVISRDLTEFLNASELLKKLETSEELLQIKNRQLEKKIHIIEEADRLQNEFVANMSHELRTPLNGIIGFAELLSDGLVEPNTKKYFEFLNDIITSSKHLVALINEVLDVAKIEAGKLEFHPKKINFPQFLAHIHNVFQTLITEKNIQFETEIDPAIEDVIIDPEKLTQVFYNYISNALKFTPPGGRVRVSIQLTNKKNFRLEVQDSGIGIRKKDLNKLFVKFQQLDSSAKKAYSGTGLGLALTKRIVEAQGGQVGVISALNKGSTFYAILPCFPYHKSLMRDKTKDASLLNLKAVPTILVIEQESQDRTLMVDALIQDGYEVITAPTVTKAIDQNQQYQFDAIVLDLFQTDMGDWEIIRNLRAKIPAENAPPIVIKAVLEQPMSIGFKIHDFLIKPVKPKELLGALKWIGVKPHHDKVILIVDNDQDALRLANHILTELGFHVVTRDSKAGALLALEQETPDVVLLDPFMSGMDGFEFLRYYRQTERGLFTPVIIWTRAKLNNDERMHLKASVQRVVLKGEELKKSILAGVGEYLPPPKGM